MPKLCTCFFIGRESESGEIEREWGLWARGWLNFLPMKYSNPNCVRCVYSVRFSSKHKPKSNAVVQRRHHRQTAIASVNLDTLDCIVAMTCIYHFWDSIWIFLVFEIYSGWISRFIVQLAVKWWRQWTSSSLSVAFSLAGRCMCISEAT